MTVVPARPAASEERTFLDWLLKPTSNPRFKDPLFARCVDAVDGTTGVWSLDVAVLVRQVARRMMERDGRPPDVIVDHERFAAADLRAARLRSIQVSILSVRLEPSIYAPEWAGEGAALDSCAVAGLELGDRAGHERLPADPFFLRATGYATYRTGGQRAAMRAAMSMAEDATLLALLPTGSGKTELAVTLAHRARRRTTVIVVPTIALAYDFERRFRDVVAGIQPRSTPAELRFAWTHETDETTRSMYRSLLVQGKLPFLVTSPESMTGALLNTLRGAADGGRLAALVIDEAHLVTQWGRDFRPEFRQLSNLRADLLRRTHAAGQPGFKTLLLSATLGELELEDLSTNFMSSESAVLVAANVLRPEPDYWVGPICHPAERQRLVSEALLQLPRPAILYVTSPDKAEEWVAHLRRLGLTRVATVTGRTAGSERRDVLAGLSVGRGERSRFDVVVATSAFGLGIDNDQIRSVIHACLPETLDRWYQEVGRAGRDGSASVAVLLPAWGDEDEAMSLGVTMLLPETARRRWTSMWKNRVSTSEGHFIDLHNEPPGALGGSYNRRWNAQVLRGLQELNQISRWQLSPDEAAAKKLPVGNSEHPHEWERIELLVLDAQADLFFANVWEPWRGKLIEESREAFDAMRAVLRPGAMICELLRNAYAPGDLMLDRFGDAAALAQPNAGCGRCPGCRAVGVEPGVPDAPLVPSRWPVVGVEHPILNRLLEAAPTAKGLSLITADDPETAAPGFAALLELHGVTYFAGVEVPPAAKQATVNYTDVATVGPADVPPVPALIVPTPGSQISLQWLIPSERPSYAGGGPVPVFLLVTPDSKVGIRCESACTLPHLTLELAEIILRKDPR